MSVRNSVAYLRGVTSPVPRVGRRRQCSVMSCVVVTLVVRLGPVDIVWWDVVCGLNSTTVLLLRLMVLRLVVVVRGPGGVTR